MIHLEAARSPSKSLRAAGRINGMPNLLAGSLSFEQLIAGQPEARGPREAGRVQTERLTQVLREELSEGRIEIAGNRYRLVGESFDPDVLGALQALPDVLP